MTEEAKRRFDAISQLWHGALASFNARRAYEIRSALALWLILGIIALFPLTSREVAASSDVRLGAATCAILIAIVHGIWLAGLARVYRTEWAVLSHYEALLHALSESEFPAPLATRVAAARHTAGPLTLFGFVEFGISLLLAAAAVATAVM